MYRHIEHLKQAHPLEAHPYFVALNRGHFSKEEFIEGQLAFYNAVRHFSRPMFLLAARLSDYPQRWVVLENIIEEHGAGRFELSHGASFVELLVALGCSEERINGYRPLNCVEVFNLTLDALCGTSDWRAGAAALGIIEARFAEISSCIGAAIVNRGWLSEKELRHYSLHEALDLEHACAFFELVAPEWPEHRGEIIRGLEVGQFVFLELYRQIFDHVTLVSKERKGA